MNDTPDAPPSPRPGPPGFIPVLPRQSRADIDAGKVPAAYAYLGAGGAAHALADAGRHDALMHLIETADDAARSSRVPLSLSNDLHKAAARARLAFGLS